MSARKPSSEHLLDILIADGVIDSPSAEMLRARLRDAWVPLGKVLRRTGKLTMGQLFDALQIQSQSPELRLGEICVKRGFCSEADVEEAVRLQAAESPHIIDLLLADENCNHHALVASLSHYVRALESQLIDPQTVGVG